MSRGAQLSAIAEASKAHRLIEMINSVAVLGAGVMGAQIAAHFANASVRSLLLDVTAEAAEQGLKRARALKPIRFHARRAQIDLHRELR